MVRRIIGLISTALVFYGSVEAIATEPPYPPSKLIRDIFWHESTYQSGADGSDLFPTTWAADGNIYTAWGDGKGFNAFFKRSYGVSTIKGNPPEIHSRDLFYGPFGSNKGKIIDLISVNGILYGTFNTQDNDWPHVSYQIVRSDNIGKRWRFVSRKWPKGPGKFEPRKFLHAGKDYSGAEDHFIYIYGRKQYDPRHFYLARVHKEKAIDCKGYEYFKGLSVENIPEWTADTTTAKPIFTDVNTKVYKINSFCVFYIINLGRYLAVTGHGDAGKIGIFDAPTPWGPWTTVAYYDKWLGMSGGIFLSMSFPGKWISRDGKNLWAVFSVHGYPKPKTYHDKFNLMKVTLFLH